MVTLKGIISDEGEVWPLVFTHEDNEVTEGEVFFTRADHSPFFVPTAIKSI